MPSVRLLNLPKCLHSFVAVAGRTSSGGHPLISVQSDEKLFKASEFGFFSLPRSLGGGPLFSFALILTFSLGGSFVLSRVLCPRLTSAPDVTRARINSSVAFRLAILSLSHRQVGNTSVRLLTEAECYLAGIAAFRDRFPERKSI